MSLDPQPAHSHLPKSTKVRSTCNACQQAKIRCSHEKPSCRRCQKHNIDCIYSMSRRLGRPAKRREGIPADQGKGKERPCRVQGRVKPGKRKTELDSHAQRQSTESKDVSIEDELRTPMLREDSFSISDNIDLGSELWLQDFVCAQSSDVQDQNLFESIDTSGSTGLNFLPLESASETLYMNASCYFPTLPSNPEIPVDYLTIPPTTAPKPVLPEYPKRNTLLDSFPDSFKAEDQSHYHFPAESSPSFSVEEPSIGAQNQCVCYEQAIRELSRRALQKLADTVLQCGTCSRSRVNLLMVIIISIDILLSALEATTWDIKAGFYSPSDEEPGVGNDFPIDDTRYSGTASTGLKAQVESCPLLVGSFRIPSDEKYCFIKQLLHTRLSGLLGTIRRIRGCTQQILASSCSRGRLIMMMETDRRLQSTMMRISTPR